MLGHNREDPYWDYRGTQMRLDKRAHDFMRKAEQFPVLVAV